MSCWAAVCVPRAPRQQTLKPPPKQIFYSTLPIFLPPGSLSGACADQLRAFHDAPLEDFMDSDCRTLKAECPYFTWQNLLAPGYLGSPLNSPILILL
jgi:hypothetical protein